MQLIGGFLHQQHDCQNSPKTSTLWIHLPLQTAQRSLNYTFLTLTTAFRPAKKERPIHHPVLFYLFWPQFDPLTLVSDGIVWERRVVRSVTAEASSLLNSGSQSGTKACWGFPEKQHFWWIIHKRSSRRTLLLSQTYSGPKKCWETRGTHKHRRSLSKTHPTPKSKEKNKLYFAWRLKIVNASKNRF